MLEGRFSIGRLGLFIHVIAGFGDVGIEINVLPNVPMTFGLWLADDEFPANAIILYNCYAVKKLHVEDLAGLCSLDIDEIIRVAESV